MSAAPLPVPAEDSPAHSSQLYAPRPARRSRALLSLVPPPVRARRAPFVALILVLLAGGLVGLLLLNTASAQDAFRLHSLQDQEAALSQQQEALISTTDGLSDPARLAQRAGQLGLVPAIGPPVFLAPGQPLPKGAIRIGDMAYIPAVVPVTPAPTVAPTPAASAAVKKPVAKTPVVKKSTAPTVKKTVAPVSRTPVAKTPVTKAPVAKTPVTKAPVAKMPVTKAPVTKTPVTKTPVTSPVQKAPAVTSTQPAQAKTGGG